MYLVKTPWWLRALYPGFTWRLPSKEKVLYLTFDDGPHETATPFVLDQLKQYDAKASFFCIGKNVMAHAGIYERILQEGHAVGNHTQQHLNGWKTKDDLYLADIREASLFIRSGLFRPPPMEGSNDHSTANCWPQTPHSKLSCGLCSAGTSTPISHLKPAWLMYCIIAGPVPLSCFTTVQKHGSGCSMHYRVCWRIFRKKDMCLKALLEICCRIRNFTG